MATIDRQVGASADDALEHNSGSVSITDSDINVWSIYPYAGIRFTNVALDGTETINNDTYISLYGVTFTTCEGVIYGEDADDAAAFTTTNDDITDRTKTTASVSWSDTWTNGAFNDSPNIKTIIQEIIDRPGWSSGNDIVILIDYASGGDFQFKAYDGSSTNAPKLHIDYTAGGGPTGSPWNTYAQQQ